MSFNIITIAIIAITNLFYHYCYNYYTLIAIINLVMTGICLCRSWAVLLEPANWLP